MSRWTSLVLVFLLALLFDGLTSAAGENATNNALPGDRLLTDYFKAEIAKISTDCRSDIQSLADWQARRSQLRRQAAEMLGLDPMPERTELQPVITGKLEEETFTVEKLYFQSQPHLYVTADLYLPRHLMKPAPAVLYLCGHLPVVTNGVSYGNKTAYQHHGIWLARNGYVCLIIDTLQYGEIQGHHRGTYDEGMWWWNSRGYTPAGIETWNAMRALDYLVSRPEVDPDRIGVTGRSGGGAYSWFLAALDERVKVIAPVAGITDLENYVVDGTVDDHCDCMFLVNTYRWDYPLLAALCAPRPLLLANTDADAYFPFDGVIRTRNAVKRVYDLYGASTNFGLVIAPGPHRDTPDLQVPVFRWFNLHLKHEDPPLGMAAVKMFTPGELKVFDKVPEDQINTRIENSFVPMAVPPEVPATAQAWKQLQQTWMKGLQEKCFAGWPAGAGPPCVTRLFSETAGGIQYEGYEIQSQPGVPLRIYLMRKAGVGKSPQLSLRVADASFTNAVLNEAEDLRPDLSQVRSFFGTRAVVNSLTQEIEDRSTAYAIFLPRGIGPTAWSGNINRETQVRRRFMLIGQTLDGMRVWDIRRAVQALRSLDEFEDTPLCLEANQEMGINALYASLFETGISALHLYHVPASHMEGPDYLNVLKILDIPEAAAMAAGRCNMRLQPEKTKGWEFLQAMATCPSAHLNVEWVK